MFKTTFTFSFLILPFYFALGWRLPIKEEIFLFNQAGEVASLKLEALGGFGLIALFKGEGTKDQGLTVLFH